MKITRRNFIKLSSLVGGGLGFYLMTPKTLHAHTVTETVFEPSLLVSIKPDNTVTFILTKQEMGQGVTTGMPMVFADEIGADLDNMKIIYSDYNPNVEYVLQGITGGSSSIRSTWTPLRQSAAAAREMLIQAAAEIWQVDKSECYTKNSHVRHQVSGRKITFGSLVERAAQLPVPQQAALKNSGDFNYIGKPVKSLKTKDIVTGTYQYGMDVSVPGMLYASIERSPVHLGKIISYDDAEARKVQGVTDIIKIDRTVRAISVGVPGWDLFYNYTIEEGLAVVATSTWAAFQGRKALKITWDDGENATAGSGLFHSRVESAKESELQITEHKGDFPSSRTNEKKIVEGAYEIPYVAHSVMEPHNTVASVSKNSCELWSGTQFAKRFVEEVSSVTGIPAENVKCHVMPAGGGFGRNWEPDFAVEAALISKAIQKPVKNVWTREDVIRHDFFHPPQLDKHQAALDENDNIIAWNTDQYCCFKFPKDAPWNPYAHAVENYRARKIDFSSPVETGPWRSVTEHKDVFTQEIFVDELAYAAKIDPLQFRLELLSKPLKVAAELQHDEMELKKLEDDRHMTREVLELAAQKAGWGSKKNLGIAVGRFSSHCAQVAEVEIRNGKPIVKNVTVAIHCGTAVNPLLIENQLQGAVIYALQALYYGTITIKNGRVQQSNFHDYKMMRISEVPEINVHVVESADPPKGVGEPGVPPLAPAVINAIFAATGKRIRKIPILKADLG